MDWRPRPSFSNRLIQSRPHIGYDVDHVHPSIHARELIHFLSSSTFGNRHRNQINRREYRDAEECLAEEKGEQSVDMPVDRKYFQTEQQEEIDGDDETGNAVVRSEGVAE